MGLVTDLDLNNPEVIATIAQRRVAHEEQQQDLAGIAAATPGAPPHVNVPWNDEMSRQVLVQLNNARRQQQRLAFPLGDNLSALIFVSLAGLTQDQRNTLTSIMTHRGRTLAQYNVQELRDLFLEMFCTTRTAVDNPMMQPSGMAQRRSFLVLEEGVKPMEPPAIEPKTKMMEQKGFLEALEDVFWFLITLNTHGIKEGSKEDKPDEAKVKEREKEKEKAEVEDTSSQEDPKAEEKEEEKAALTWREKKDMKKIGKKKKTGRIPGTKAIRPMIKTGMMAIVPQKNCTTRMSMVISRRKEKERKVRKARMMKDKANQEMARASQTMFGHKLHQILPFKPNNNNNNNNNNNRLIILLQSQVHGMVSFLWLKNDETDPERVDVLFAKYEELEYHRRTCRGGQSQRDAMAQRNRENMKRFPVLVGEVDALQEGLHQRPLPVGLQPAEKGASFFTIGYSDQAEIPNQHDALIKQRYHLKGKLDTLAKKRHQLSLNALIKQRNHLRRIVPVRLNPTG